MTFSDPLASCSFGGGDNVGAHPLAGGCSLALSRSLSLSLCVVARFRAFTGKAFKGYEAAFGATGGGASGHVAPGFQRGAGRTGWST